MEALLTQEELNQWNEDGYLVLRNVLSSQEIQKYLTLADKFYSKVDKLSPEEQALIIARNGNERDWVIPNFPEQTDSFDNLLDHQGFFSKILGLMGPTIQICGTQLMYRFPHEQSLLGMHTDGGPSLGKILPTSNCPVIHLKSQIFLTDCDKPNSGNMVIIPGSHKHPFPENREQVQSLWDQAVPILARAGDVVIFPWSLHHAVTHNNAGRRVSIIIRFGQMWTRPIDYDKCTEEVLWRQTPRRQLLFGYLGDLADSGDYYSLLGSNFVETMYGPNREQYSEFRTARTLHAGEDASQIYGASDN